MKIAWHSNPDEAVRDKCRYLEKVRKTDGTQAYWGLMREVLRTDPWFLFRVALEWGFLDDKLVGTKFIKHIAEHWGEDAGVLFPRGHGKTVPFTGLSIFSMLNNPNIAILEISRTDDNAEKIGTYIAETLMYNDYLQQCFGTHSKTAKHEDRILPASKQECSQWGKDGYSLPNRKRRIDPTLLTISLKSAKAGKHPDIIWLDDPTELENNDTAGWEQVVKTVRQCQYMLQANGFFWWSGTRYHDSDPLGMALKGKLRGKQGAFSFIQSSCFIDDNPKKGPVYPKKKRWNMDVTTGYDMKSLEEQEAEDPDMFAAQMRNDPSPLAKAKIDVSLINIYEEEKIKDFKLSEIQAFGIETTGGGLPIYNGFIEYCERMRFSLPLVEISNPQKKGTTKADRIQAVLQPIIFQGKLHAQECMIGNEFASEGLGYELRRLDKATHDDIADALHNVPLNLSKGIAPQSPDEPMHLYISTDLAWTDGKKSDYSVIMAVAVDYRNHFWVLDYERFKLSLPSQIHEKLIEFYRKYETAPTIRQGNRKYPGTWR